MQSVVPEAELGAGSQGGDGPYAFVDGLFGGKTVAILTLTFY